MRPELGSLELGLEGGLVPVPNQGSKLPMVVPGAKLIVEKVASISTQTLQRVAIK